jgi:type IV fimbrial biogenesis protein FimT
LITVLTLARSEAVKRGTRVTVCKSANQATCTMAGAWTQGWIAFTDDGDGVVETGSGESILRVQPALTGGLSITGDGFEDYVSYVATGEIRKNELEGGGLHNGTLTVCHTESATAREITVNRVGRIRLIEEAECP